MKKEYISEDTWSKNLKFLRSCKGIYVRTESHSKKFIEAIFWMSRTGVVRVHASAAGYGNKTLKDLGEVWVVLQVKYMQK